MGIEIHYEFLFHGSKAELAAALETARQAVAKLAIPMILPISEHDGSGEVGFHFVIEHDPSEFPPADASPLGEGIFILSDATTLSLGFKPITPSLWICSDSIKTSAAEYPVQVHNKACDIIDVLAKLLTADIDDETGFYKTRDMAGLTKKHEEFEGLMQEAAILLPDALAQKYGIELKKPKEDGEDKDDGR